MQKEKELDLSMAQMANDKYNIERIKRKSIQDSNNSKRQRIHGELYRGKKVTKKKIQNTCLAVASIAVIIAAGKGIKHIDTTSTYNAVLNNTIKDELSYSESVDFLENYDKPKEHYENYIEALESLDDTEYDFFGNRKDGTHNEVIKDDPGSLINYSDKEKDAMVNAVEDEIQEYKGAK